MRRHLGPLQEHLRTPEHVATAKICSRSGHAGHQQVAGVEGCVAPGSGVRVLTKGATEVEVCGVDGCEEAWCACAAGQPTKPRTLLLLFRGLLSVQMYTGDIVIRTWLWVLGQQQLQRCSALHTSLESGRIFWPFRSP